MPSASVVKHLEEKGITRATWKRAQDQLHKEGRLAYVRDGRAMWWRWVDPDTKSELVREAAPSAPSQSPESPESESQPQSEPAAPNGSVEEWEG